MAETIAPAGSRINAGRYGFRLGGRTAASVAHGAPDAIESSDEALLDRMAVAKGQHARCVFFADAPTDQNRAFAGVQQFAPLGDLLDARHRAGVLEAAGQRHGNQVDAGTQR
jgi:hypothetical protein